MLENSYGEEVISKKKKKEIIFLLILISTPDNFVWCIYTSHKG